MSKEIKSKERKVFLDHLPRYYSGDGESGNNGSVNWGKSIGMNFNFEYFGIKGVVEIVDYNIKTKKVVLKYKNNIEDIFIGHIKDCKIGKVLGVVTGNFKIEIGSHFKDNKRDIIITNRKKIKMNRKDGRSEYKKYYQFKCNICGFDCGEHYTNDKNKQYKKDLWLEESKILGNRQGGCACCHGDITVEDINSIVSKDNTKWMIDYFPGGYNEAKKYMPQSNNSIYVKCPDCGRISDNKASIANIYYRHSYQCTCNDGISFPEKLTMGILEQLNLKYEFQKTFSWSKVGNSRNRKVYDFYIKDMSAIIEVHGDQHYRDAWNKVDNTIENDIYKEKLAKENGIRNYIVIDCRYSEFDYIKSNFVKNDTFSALGLENIDWDKVMKCSMPNISKKVATYWNNKQEWETVTSISKIFNINSNTVRRYLKIWTEIGYCNYDAEYKKVKNDTRKHKPKRSKKDILLSKQSA